MPRRAILETTGDATARKKAELDRRLHVVSPEYAQWLYEYDLLNEHLKRVEEAERAVLLSMRCPTGTVALYDILNNKTPAPWPKRTSARDRQRALHAMHVLLQIEAVRRNT